MAYSIQYTSSSTQTEMGICRKGKRPLIWILFFCFLAGVYLARKPMREVLLPGDPAVTDAAFAQMVERLEAGDGVYKAVQVFCQEIVNGAH